MNPEQARFNMVEQQIRTWEVLDQGILDLLFLVRREDFVPADYRLLAFADLEIPLGKLTLRGRKIDPMAIRRTALLTVEGERDDICAIGQTLAAQELTRLRPWLRTHHVQPNVGHYGVFSGRRWQQHIYPVVRNVIQVSQ